MSQCIISTYQRIISRGTEFPNPTFSVFFWYIYQEAVAIGRTFASMKDYQLDGNKEMVALGTMNIVGSLTSCYVATGEKNHMKVFYR